MKIRDAIGTGLKICKNGKFCHFAKIIFSYQMESFLNPHKSFFPTNITLLSLLLQIRSIKCNYVCLQNDFLLKIEV